MRTSKNVVWLLLIGLSLILFTTTCSPPGDEAAPTSTPTPTPTPEQQPPEVEGDPTATPTPTPAAIDTSTDTPTPCPCEGVSGTIEVQILVGPAAEVGLEPFAVGSIPFSAACGAVEGQDQLSYQDVLTADWGTYAVTFEADVSIAGTCAEDTGLNVTLNMSGSQFVEVTAEGFHGEYPWEGEHSFDLHFPLEDGATVEGEGFAFVLHLN